MEKRIKNIWSTWMNTRPQHKYLRRPPPPQAGDPIDLRWPLDRSTIIVGFGAGRSERLGRKEGRKEMGEEAPGDYELLAMREDDRVSEWEAGLPGADELTPLSQPLVPPGLAAAFRIPPEPGRTLLDVHRASAATVSRLRRASSSSSSSFPGFEEAGAGAGANSKRPRLVWTPQLHKRFVDVVAHLGIKNAVPKTIMQLMNVEGLTRENVASHLQKYRLYVKRMQGLSNEGPSPSDHIFASTPVPPSLVVHEVPVPTPYAAAMYHHAPMGVAVGMVPMNNHHHHHQSSAGGYNNGYGHHPQPYHHGHGDHQ